MRPQRWRQYTPKLGTLLSGALIVFSFPPWNLWPLITFALVPWLLLLRSENSTRSAVTQGVWLSVFMTLGGYFWVAYATQRFGRLPWPAAVITLFAFSTFNQIQFPIFAATHLWLKKIAPASWIMRAALSATLYTAIDSWCFRLFLDTLGHSLYLAPSLRQWAAVGGAGLLTFLIVFGNALLAEGWFLGRRRSAGLAAAALWGLAWAGGLPMLHDIRERQEKAPKSAQIAAIQGNIGDFEKVAAKAGAAGAAQQVLDTHMRLTDQALALNPAIDAVVWPETTYPSTFRKPWGSVDRGLDRQLELFVHARQVPLLFGGYDTVDGKDFNSLFALVPGSLGPKNPKTNETAPSNALQVYHKHVLLPFGEYIPGFGETSVFKKWFPNMGFFGRGAGAQVLEIPLKGGSTLKFSPLICYEALVSDYSLDAARKGSELILNITNDSWFGPWGEPHLHLALTVFRSIETGIPQLRSTNTGISALILPDGEIRHPTGIRTSEIMNAHVPLLAPHSTPMMRWGQWFPRLITALAVLLVASLMLFRRFRSQM